MVVLENKVHQQNRSEQEPEDVLIFVDLTGLLMLI